MVVVKVQIQNPYNRRKTMNTNMIIPENIPTFDLEVSIIPNLPNCFSNRPEDGHSVCEPDDWWNMKVFAGFGDDVKRLGINPQDIELSTRSMWVNVRTTCLGIDSRSCEGTELYKFIKDKDCGEKHDYLLPDYLPEEFLDGVEEGTVKETYITKYASNPNDFTKKAIARIRWTFRQEGHRYNNFGKFGELLKKLLTRARAYRRAA